MDPNNPLYKDVGFEELRLTQNMRVKDDSEEPFRAWLRRIGIFIIWFL